MTKEKTAPVVESYDKAIVLREVSSKMDLLEAFAEAFGFGEHFGKNWDALTDSLVEKVTEQHLLVVVVEHGLEEADYDTLYGIVDDVNETVPEQYLELFVIHSPPNRT